MICRNVSGFQDILVQIDNWSSCKWRSSQNELWEALLVWLNGDLGRKGDCLLLLILSLLLVSKPFFAYYSFNVKHSHVNGHSFSQYSSKLDRAGSRP